MTQPPSDHVRALLADGSQAIKGYGFLSVGPGAGGFASIIVGGKSYPAAQVVAALSQPVPSPANVAMREGLEAILAHGVERDIKWAGMTARDIARETLRGAATPPINGEASPVAEAVAAGYDLGMALSTILEAQMVQPYRGWNITALKKAADAARELLGLPSVRDLNPDIAKMQDHALANRDAISALSTPPRPDATARERVARIIDPDALNPDLNECANYNIITIWPERRDMAYTKADTILAALAHPQTINKRPMKLTKAKPIVLEDDYPQTINAGEEDLPIATPLPDGDLSGDYIEGWCDGQDDLSLAIREARTTPETPRSDVAQLSPSPVHDALFDEAHSDVGDE